MSVKSRQRMPPSNQRSLVFHYVHQELVTKDAETKLSHPDSVLAATTYVLLDSWTSNGTKRKGAHDMNAPTDYHLNVN